MVRTKAKKQKGDDAFQTRKQKVGRKKLAPATATRAEVHARTLRLNTSSALAHAPTAPPTSASKHPDTLVHPNDGKRSRRRGEDEAAALSSTMNALHSVPELLAATHHYKSANRASAFATLAKALAAQELRDAAEASRPDANRFTGFIPAPSATAAAKSRSSDPAQGFLQVTPLERLKTYTAALEAITDTDDDVRRAALSCLAIILQHQWISTGTAAAAGVPPAHHKAGRTGALYGGASSLSSSSSSNAVASLAQLEAAWTATHEAVGESGASGRPPLGVFGVGSTRADKMFGVASAEDSGEQPLQHHGENLDVAAQDRMKAALQAVHIAFTHAMKGVRVSGVELLSLVLANARPGAVVLAARAVSCQQHAYLPLETAGDAIHADAHAAGGGGGDPKERAAAAARAEEAWMVALLKRLSQLVLRTKELPVLPWLLSALLTPPAAASSAGLAAVTSTGRGRELTAASVWHNPDLIADFFNDVLPQWSNAWKGLMELQLGLLRQEDKLVMAVALGRAFAVVVNFLKREQIVRNVEERQQLVARQQHLDDVNATTAAVSRASANRLLSKAKQQTIKELFIHKVPVTVEEILKSHSSSSNQEGGGGNGGFNARVELALVLVQVCTPLAGTDEGWAVLDRFFKAIFAPREAGTRKDSGSASPVAVLHCLNVYIGLLHLFPKRLTTATMPLVNEASATEPERETSKDGQEEAGTGVGAAQSSAAPASPRPRRAAAGPPGGLWSAANIASNSLDRTSGSAVFEKLIVFAPHLLQAVLQQLNQYQEHEQKLQWAAAATAASVSSPASGSREESVHRGAAAAVLGASRRQDQDAAVLVQLLLGASEVVALLAGYPLSAAAAAASHGVEGRLSQSIRDVLTRVPRLLFALRPQSPQAVAAPLPSSRKRSRAAADAVGRSSDEEETREREPESVLVDLTILTGHPALVDMLVHRFLQPLWFMASSGHPLLTAAASAGSGGSLRESLRTALQPLFGLALPSREETMPGVLARCSAATVAVAQETLFFLGVRDQAKLTVREGPGGADGQSRQDANRQPQRSERSAPAFDLEDVLMVLP